MNITFLGTGTSQGVPIIGCKCKVCQSDDPKDKRLRTSILLEDGGNNFVIDTGPDFRQQMLREKVDKLDGVIFTHEHKDHTAGFDDVRAFNFIQKKKIEVYATASVQKSLRQEFSYIFSDFKYPGIPEINLHTIANNPFKILETQFIPIEVLHYKLPVLGFRIGEFTYITDANYISDQELEKVKGSRVLVLNALRLENHISHFTLDQAIEMMNKIKPERGFFTHISHQLGSHREASQLLPSYIELAYDGLQINL
jgi:phosphoribosyl 1,2-cyclic phosphate phosphodiesterase